MVTVDVLCEGGQVITHDLPLPEGLAERVAAGQARIIDPALEASVRAAEDQAPDPCPDPEPVKSPRGARKTTPPKP